MGKQIKTFGLVFVGLFAACAIIAIILAGIQYKYSSPNWKEMTWNPLSALEIACIIYSFFIAAFGILTFTIPSLALTIVYGIFLMLSILFCLAIAIMALIGGSYGTLDLYLGCNSSLKGIFDSWQGMDTYLQNVDQNLCSPSCPCYFSNTLPFQYNSTVLATYNSWTKTSNTYDSTAFQNCSNVVQQTALAATMAKNPSFNSDGSFSFNNLQNYYANIESTFQCSGFCNPTYFNTNTNQTTTMYKYLFTNVNNGPVQYTGCLSQLLLWLPPYLAAWGSVTMVLAGLQIIVFILAMIQCSLKEEPKDVLHQDQQ